jgi:hypothetical protein
MRTRTSDTLGRPVRHVPPIKIYLRPRISDHLPDSVNETVAVVRWAMGIQDVMDELSVGQIDIRCQSSLSTRMEPQRGEHTECLLVLDDKDGQEQDLKAYNFCVGHAGELRNDHVNR